MKPVAARPAPGQQQGHVIVTVALLLFVLMIMAAMAVDVGLWYHRSTEAQRAADSAALSAVTEYVAQRKAGRSVTDARAAARSRAVAVARENGFDTADGDVTVTATFSTGAGGADHVRVRVNETNLPLIFSGAVVQSMQVNREAEATMSLCQAACNQRLTLQTSTGAMVDTGTGGDGWQAEIADDYVFNLYHHDNGKVLYCVDRVANTVCGPPGRYPVQPYPGILTNFSSTTTSDGTSRVWFVVQTATAVGLGCWDGATAGVCTGYATPRPLAAYRANGDNDSVSRLDGPERVGDRLFMYGDDNRMYCWNTATNAVCTGYPRATTLTGTRNMVLTNAAAGFAGGVRTDGGVQFDMLVHPDGRIYTVLGPTADGKSWLTCWNTVADATCTGWSNVSATVGWNALYFMYDGSGAPTGLCARSARRGAGSSAGQQCYTLSGGAMAAQVTTTFNSSDHSRESADARTSTGHWITFFPSKNGGALCWDWTTRARCAYPPSNWRGMNDYAYTWDGERCMIGLGHEGLMWTFGVDDGQYPCKGGPAGAKGRFTPCPCADGTSTRWTILSLTRSADLDDFTRLVVTIRLPGGAVWRSVDLVATGATSIDLRLLNEMASVPAYVDVEVEAAVVPGREEEVFTTEQNGLGLESGVVPTLVD